MSNTMMGIPPELLALMQQRPMTEPPQNSLLNQQMAQNLPRQQQFANSFYPSLFGNPPPPAPGSNLPAGSQGAQSPSSQAFRALLSGDSASLGQQAGTALAQALK